jgi:hypothetical protein
LICVQVSLQGGVCQISYRTQEVINESSIDLGEINHQETRECLISQNIRQKCFRVISEVNFVRIEDQAQKFRSSVRVRLKELEVQIVLIRIIKVKEEGEDALDLIDIKLT